MQCQAKAKHSGAQCRRRAVTGMRVCQVHGGVTPKGPASPHWTSGRHSKILPKRLLDDYLVARDDPDKLVLEDELALIDSRINDLLGRVDSGESGQLWTALRKTVRELEAAQRARDTVGVAAAVTTLVDTIKRGHGDVAAWRDVTDLIERRRRLVDAERKRLVAAQQMIGIEEALALMGLLVEAVRKHVRDDGALRAVTAEFARLTDRPVPTEEPSWPAGMQGRSRWNA